MGIISVENPKTLHRMLPFDDAVSLTGFGCFNLFVLLATGGCLMCVIIETMSMMFVIPAAECDLQLTLSTKGYLSAASFLGVVAGSHFWGFLADTRGRKKMILVSMISSIITTLISSVVPTAWPFIALRFLNGLCIGGSSGIVYAYAGEFHDNRHRPKMVSWMGIFVAFGNMILPGLAWLILPARWSLNLPLLGVIFRPWRLLVIAYGLPSVIFTMFITILPESPKYLLTQGKTDEALDVLKKMYMINWIKPKSKFPVTSIIWDTDNTVETKGTDFFGSLWRQTVPLIRKPFISKTVIVCALQFGAFASTSGLAMWYPEILNRMITFERENPGHELNVCTAIRYHLQNVIAVNDSLTDTSMHCNDSIETEVFTIGIIIGTFLAVMYVVIGTLINLIGKKNLLIAFFIISSAAGLAAQYVYGSEAVKLLMGLALISTTSIGIITAVIVDLYPTQIRAMALAISLMFGRIGAMTGSHLTGIIFYQLCNYTFHIFMANNIILIGLVILLPISTRVTQMIQTIT